MELKPNNKTSYDNDKVINVAKYKEIPTVSKEIIVNTEKDRTKLIFHIESIIRQSLEYKEYISFLKDFMNKDSFFSNVEQLAYNKVKIELHHSPLTLFDIVSVVMQKHQDEYDRIDIFDIADEVMELHYQCRVGLLPLSISTHKLVHLGEIFIPVQMVRGDWASFYREYAPFFNQDLVIKLQNTVRFSKEIQDVSLLETKYTYIEVDGFKQIQLLNPEELFKKQN